MKRLALVFLAAATVQAADFATGQAARLVIGQPTFTEQEPTSSDLVLGGAGGLAFANNTLFVTDANRVGAMPINHRVLLYKNLSEMLPSPEAEHVYTQRCPVCTGAASLVLGQPDFAKGDMGLSDHEMRLPVAVASDGTILAVADTDNNRVLIWNRIPTENNAPADVVLGQPDFAGNSPNAGTGDPQIPGPKTLRGPAGIWIQNGKLFVADTGNDRVLIWNSIPTSNFEPADLVLGQPDFKTGTQQDLLEAKLNPRANTMLTPVSVTSDGTRLFVADLGYNRVLIWNSIPAENSVPADVVIGQPDMTSSTPNNVKSLCEPNGTNEEGEDTFPNLCAATLDFPRYALSDGTRLFIADGGNDRVLVFNQIPTSNGAKANTVLGQWTPDYNVSSDSAFPLQRAAADNLRTPTSLAWDGTNLFVSDPFNRRVMVFTPGDLSLPVKGVRNFGSREVYAVGTITVGGEIEADDEITVKIGDREYKYTVAGNDTLTSVVNGLVDLINAGDGDPDVSATPNTASDSIVLTARTGGETGNDISFSIAVSEGALIGAQTSGSTLSGGGDAAKIAPGSLIVLFGENMSDTTATAPLDADSLPEELGGVQLYFDGVRAPLLYVSPSQIHAQVPFEFIERTSLSAYVRTKRADGSITLSTPVAVPMIPQNPGILAEEGNDPRKAVALHASSQATGMISIDGTPKAGDVATITIEDRSYSYTVQEGDTTETVRDWLTYLVSEDPKVYAFESAYHTRIRLRARQPGPEGNGITYRGSSTNEDGEAGVTVNASGSALCCANAAYSPLTIDNPAVPGETIILFATGLGLVKPDEARESIVTGQKYAGPLFNDPVEFVNSMIGAKTGNVLAAGLKPGSVGIYQVELQLNPDLPTNPVTQLWIAQDIYISNVVTIPVARLEPDPETVQ